MSPWFVGRKTSYGSQPPRAPALTALVSLKARDEILRTDRRSSLKEAELPFTEESKMTRLIIVSAALIAAAAYQTAQAAARSDVTGRHRAAAQSTADCVRAPAVGAFASAPYTQPPCLPNKSN